MYIHDGNWSFKMQSWDSLVRLFHIFKIRWTVWSRNVVTNKTLCQVQWKDDIWNHLPEL